jgi:hypothetical protein
LSASAEAATAGVQSAESTIDVNRSGKRQIWHLTMRLSDAGLRRRQTTLLYLNHRSSPWLTEDATRDRSNRLLDRDLEAKA